MAPLINNPYDFYKVLTFKWHVSKFEPIRIISLQISYLSEANIANFQNNGKIWISSVDKALLSDGEKILFKQSNGLISVIRTLLHQKQWLRGDMLTLNVVVLAQIVLNAHIAQIWQLSRKTPKNSTNWFCPILNRSCMR